jgi:hypothetical protein
MAVEPVEIDIGQRIAIDRPAAPGEFTSDPVLAWPLFATQARKADERLQPFDLALKISLDCGGQCLVNVGQSPSPSRSPRAW